MKTFLKKFVKQEYTRYILPNLFDLKGNLDPNHCILSLTYFVFVQCIHEDFKIFGGPFC